MAGPSRRTRGIEGECKGARVLVVEARFYEDISDALWAGAKRVLEKAGVGFDRVTVPGSLEIPQAIAIAADAAVRSRSPYDGAVALGCVIRGETSHYDIVAGESARGLMDVAIARGLPIGNGILTVDSRSQALARASIDESNKGGGAATAALELIALKRRLVAQR